MQGVGFRPFVHALSGGTFQDMRLLEGATEMLEERGFIVHRHRRVPAGDGGLALGQAVLANAMSKKRDVAKS
jgi:hydrogenase maturation protein HypF